MRTLIGLLLGAIAFTALAASGDNSIGTWKLNMAKSKFTPDAPVKSLTTTREATSGGVKITTTGEMADGSPLNASAAAKYDGSESAATGAPWDTMTIKQVDANTFTGTSRKKDGKYRSTSRTVISKDGKTMTVTSKGANAEGKPFNYVLVYDKQ